MAIFFFKNLRNPEKQTDKFLQFYCAENWALKEGDDDNLLRTWVQHANRWVVKDDPMNRFDASDLAMWEQLYRIAPDSIKPDMLDGKTCFDKTESIIHITCRKPVTEWINGEEFIETEKIMRPWARGKNVTYSYPF